MVKSRRSLSRKEIEYRVVAGSLKGRRIVVPDLGVTRPPLTRLRKSIFDFLTPYIGGASYLDLFSGTGSYLFEAVSRGADVVRGVEREEKLAAAINRQAAEAGVDDQLQCLCADVFVAIPDLGAQRQRFDIIMTAPPQYAGLIDQTLKALRDNPLVSADGLIICQHDTSETAQIEWHGFPISQQRQYGNTTFTVLTPSG